MRGRKLFGDGHHGDAAAIIADGGARYGIVDRISLAIVDQSADQFEGSGPKRNARLDAACRIGSLTIACALGYLDFRFASFDWRISRPALADWFAITSQRPAMRDTFPKEG
jgi:glutathione S-transferase